MKAILFIVNMIFGIIETILAVRFLLKLLGGNAEADFVKKVYENSEVLIQPFTGIFNSFSIGNFIIEFNTLLSIGVYGLGGYFLIELLAYTYKAFK